MKRWMKYGAAVLAAVALLTGCRDEDSERLPRFKLADEQVVFGDYGESKAVAFTATDIVTVSVSELKGWRAEVRSEQGKWQLELTSPDSGEQSVSEGSFELTGYAVDGMTSTAMLGVRVDLSLPPQATLKEAGWRVFDPLESAPERMELETLYATTLEWSADNAALFPGWQVSFPDVHTVSVTPPDSYAVYTGEAAPGGLLEIEATRPTSTEKAVVKIPVRLAGGLFRMDEALFDRSDAVELTGGFEGAPYAGLLCNQWIAADRAAGGGFRSAVAYFSNDMTQRDQHTAGVVLRDGGELSFDGSTYTPGERTEPVELLYFLVAGDGTTTASFCTYRHTDALESLCLAADADPRSEENELLREILLDAWARTADDDGGHAYGLIRIGDRFWLRENLRTARLADGGQIVPDKPGEVTEPRPDYTYCPYADDAENGALYGYLYDRAASLAGGLCPEGYTLPDDATLAGALLYAGDPMPAGSACSGTWNGQQGEAPDWTGFAGLPGGRRQDDAYSGLGDEALYWTVDGLRTLRYEATQAETYTPERNPYAYVRCVEQRR